MSTVDDLEVEALKRQARINRSKFQQSPLGKVARTLSEAMGEYHKMREQGVSQEDAVKGLEAVLREVLPAKSIRYRQCEFCQETGWKQMVCRYDARCNRERCGIYPPEWEHSYVVPCDCEKGDRFRAKTQTTDDTLASVGRSKKAVKGWSKLGA